MRDLSDRKPGGGHGALIGICERCDLLKHLRFEERIKGSHHVFTREGVEEIINLQDVGGMCKPYQVRQMRAVLKKYNLHKEL